MFLVKNGTLVSPKGSRRADLLVDGEKIVRIEENISAPEGCTLLMKTPNAIATTM